MILKQTDERFMDFIYAEKTSHTVVMIQYVLLSCRPTTSTQEDQRFLLLEIGDFYPRKIGDFYP